MTLDLSKLDALDALDINENALFLDRASVRALVISRTADDRGLLAKIDALPIFTAAELRRRLEAPSDEEIARIIFEAEAEYEEVTGPDDKWDTAPEIWRKKPRAIARAVLRLLNTPGGEG